MKKILILFSILYCCLSTAQIAPTEFLGIPIDGSSTTMTERLYKLGFKQDSAANCLTGVYNDKNVNVKVITNEYSKVWRVLVIYDISTSSSEIKKQYNKLCSLFFNDKEYAKTPNHEYFIPQYENISDQLLKTHKSYKANFIQCREFVNKVLNEEEKKAYVRNYLNSQSNLTPNQIEDYYLKYYAREVQNRNVTLDILYLKDEFILVVYYDNLYNKPKTRFITQTEVVAPPEPMATTKKKHIEGFGSSTNSHPLTIAERMPSFKGNITQWLAQNIIYPTEAANKSIQGKVIVRFVVNSDGSVSNATIVREVDPLLDKEALRVVEAMPKWNPGMNEGKPVAVWFTLPITFKLEEIPNNSNKVHAEDLLD